jgi:hypothetical protein
MLEQVLIAGNLSNQTPILEFVDQASAKPKHAVNYLHR